MKIAGLCRSFGGAAIGVMVAMTQISDAHAQAADVAAARRRHVRRYGMSDDG